MFRKLTSFRAYRPVGPRSIGILSGRQFKMQEFVIETNNLIRN